MFPYKLHFHDGFSGAEAGHLWDVKPRPMQGECKVS